MSLNQSRLEKREATQYRKADRSSSYIQPRGSQGSTISGKGGGSSGSVASGPPPISSAASHLNRSFKKPINNVQEAQTRAGNSGLPAKATNSSEAVQSAQSRARAQSASLGASNGPVASNVSSKPSDASTRKTSQPGGKHSGHSAANSSISSAPVTPAKGGGGKVVSLQFGSLSPGLVNGMQIPARTSSAPPNLDEQKKDQARNDTYKNTQTAPVPAVPKQNLPKKESNAVISSSSMVTPSVQKTKEMQTSSLPAPICPQKPPVHTVPQMPTHMPFHQPQASLPFGAPNMQMHPQGMTVPISMAVPLGSAPQSQQPVFVPTLQHHVIQPSGIVPHGQGINYPTSLGPQPNPQIGSLGIGVTAQYSQQQAGNIVASRKSVSIRDPTTREEVIFDKPPEAHVDGGPSTPRVHSGAPSQSQSLPPFMPPHPINYYGNSYGTNIFFSASSSVPLAGVPSSSGPQATRFNYQVGQTPHFNPSVSNKTGNEPLNFGTSVIVSAPSAPQVTIKPSPLSIREKGGISLSSSSQTVVAKGESHKNARIINNGSITSSKETEILPEVLHQPLRPGHEVSTSTSLLSSTKQSVVLSATVPTNSSTLDICERSSTVLNNDVMKKEAFNKSDFSKDHLKKSINEGKKPLHVTGEETFVPILSSQVLENRFSSNDMICGKFEAEAKDSFANNEGGMVKSEQVQLSPVNTANPVSSALDTDVAGSTEQKLEISSFHVADDSVAVVQEVNRKSETQQTEQEQSVVSDLSEKLEKSPSEVQPLKSDYISKEQAEVPDINEKTMPIIVLSLESIKEPEGVAKLLEKEDKMGSSCLVSSSKASDSSDLQPVAANLISSSSSDTDGLIPGINSDKDGKVAWTVKASLPDSVASAAAVDSTSKPEIGRLKSTIPRGRRKRKEILQKADAAGTSSDLYMAYKGPEEKKEVATSGGTELPLAAPLASAIPGDAISTDKSSENKFEPDDWEDAADISTAKLENSCDTEQSDVKPMLQGTCFKDSATKKYSRDFLLKFSEKFLCLPEDFNVKPDIEVLLAVDMNISYPLSLERSSDRSSGGSRLNRHVNGLGDDDKWSKLSGGRMDAGYGNNLVEFRPGQGASHGVLRNPRLQHKGQLVGGILSGPVHSVGSHGGIQRNMSGPDADRWQRSTGFQKGLMPSPQAPLPAMHKAERKYEVGKVADEEQAKQRQLKAILNKLTPQNFEKLFEQVKAVNIDNAVTLSGVISQIFDKALMEPTFCEMYANFCSHLSVELPDFSEDNEKITFKRLLLNKCQEEFEKGEREEEEANKVEDGINQTEGEREEKRIKARRRMLGNIRLIGELYKKKMLTERIMHECIVKLLGQCQTPDEEDIEALCKLMSTIGEMIDHAKAKEHMDAYFDRMTDLSNNMALSSRVRFMLKDAIDLRKNKWQQRRKVEGPKKIEEVHRDAAQERQAQAGRLSRGPGMNPSSRRMQPTDFTQQFGAVPSSVQVGSYRALHSQSRGFGNQDFRFEERSSQESRLLSVPLSQRSVSDDTITLGPQGGLGRGMSVRGQTSAPGVPMTSLPSGGDLRRTSGLNGHSAVAEKPACSSREDAPRLISERFSNEQATSLQHGVNRNARTESGPDKTLSVPSTQVPSSEAAFPEERLRDMSILAIKEFYSAKDEKEVAMCIRDLNSPSFYPTMISLWVTDSFEQKDLHRDLLGKLLINLTTSNNAILTQFHLIKGFEAVLTTLEDAVNDAPKAAEFLGRLFARVILENVVSLREIGQLIYDGGEEPGCLREAGLAAEVMGSTLDVIKTEKGQSGLSEIRANSNLRLEDFRHPDPSRSKKLDMLI